MEKPFSVTMVSQLLRGSILLRDPTGVRLLSKTTAQATLFRVVLPKGLISTFVRSKIRVTELFREHYHTIIGTILPNVMNSAEKEWAKLSLNPEAITSIFNSSPDLSEVELVSIELNREGSRCIVNCVYRGGPDRVPTRWNMETVKRVSLKLIFIDISQLVIDGWSNQISGPLAISRESDNKIQVNFRCPHCSFSATADFFRIDRIQPVE